MRSAGEVVGAVVLVVGVLALLGTVGGDVGLAESFRWLWPLLVVGLGLWLMVAASDRRRTRPPVGWGPSPTDAAGTGPGPWDDGSVGPANAWGAPGTASGWTTPAGSWGAAPTAWAPGGLREQRFLGEIEMAGPMQAGPMRIETFIGEIRLDLTLATFPDGETPIHVSTAIGEVRVLLPPDIPAAVRVSSMLGESEAMGRVSGALMGEARAETEDFAGATRRIRLEAQSLIGEVAVRRARRDSGVAAADTPGTGFVPVSGAAPGEVGAMPPDAGTTPPDAGATAADAGATAAGPGGQVPPEAPTF